MPTESLLEELTPREREVCTEPIVRPGEVPHRLLHRPIPRLEDLVKRSLQECENHSHKIGADIHTIEHALNDLSSSLDDLASIDSRAQTALQTPLSAEQRSLALHASFQTDQEHKLASAADTIARMEAYVGKEKKWERMDQIIAEKQRMREEEILAQKRRSERRSQMLWQSVGYSIALLVVIVGGLLARWTIREAVVLKGHAHQNGDL